ncbi:MAG: hypothetical protein Q4E99_04975 [Bacillota bacterium]|nr:hypothetical protein [Bacillota bacterium]
MCNEMNAPVLLDAVNFKLNLKATIYRKHPVDNNVVLQVAVCSDGFAGIADMDVSEDNLKLFVKQIHTMNKNAKGSAELKETYGKNYISMEMDKTGHVIVRGYLRTNSNELSFSNKFEIQYLDMFDKELANPDAWQEVV